MLGTEQWAIIPVAHQNPWAYMSTALRVVQYGGNTEDTGHLKTRIK